MYAPRNADDTYWDIEYFVPALGKKVKVIDYASACYVRTSWSSLNPSDGVYAWEDPNSKIGKLLKGAQTRGLPIALRIVVDGRDQGQNTPKFVFDLGAKYYLENENHPDRQTPYPQDAVFRKYYTKFITALAKEFNDPEKTSFIDAYGLGKWGEAHYVVYEDPKMATPESTEKIKEETLDWVTSLYANTFTKVPLVINYHRLVGHPESWGAVNPNSERLLDKAIDKGYSLRQDAFGMTGYYQNWEKDFAKKWNFKRPIIMEGGWIIAPGKHRYWTDPSGKYREGHDEDVRKGEFDLSAEAHVNMMDFRAGGETESWFKSFDLVQRFITEGGYRVYPDQINLPQDIKSGKIAQIAHRWQNMGWGYLPNNIPQWNYKYKVAFALLDANGNVKKIFVDRQSEPSAWLKGTAASYKLIAKVDLPSGIYSWAVAIVDTTKENKPAIQLALDGDLTAQGWTKLSALQVK
ncbi:DUF4832 domain-containing protein [Sphingobacterium sp. Lzh-3]|uniref:DUF4832 domain-containing protein n=1 Tax=Sphingobacterium sp. Lzh-3 TaxID=3382150 RepID=UPI00398CF743